jgi:tetratricopeptide (TPR) repeat protein
MDEGDAKVAGALFDEVERQHPYSPWARRAQLMSAFAYYSGKDYTKSIQAAQRFLSIHPGNKDAPYAYYLIALCYYEQIQDVTRDQKITLQALSAMNDVVRRFPDTRYATDARLKVDLINDHLAGKKWTSAVIMNAPGAGWPRTSVSAMWSINIRTPTTRPRPCSAWSDQIWPSACPKRRRNMPPCWVTTIRAASGIRRPMP